MTIREQIYQIQSEAKQSDDLQPARASELLVMLSALYGNVLNEIKDSDLIYNKILLSFLESDEKANRAKIKAECSDEYARKLEARNVEKLTLELMRSLKYFLRNKEEETKNINY